MPLTLTESPVTLPPVLSPAGRLEPFHFQYSRVWGLDNRPNGPRPAERTALATLGLYFASLAALDGDLSKFVSLTLVRSADPEHWGQLDRPTAADNRQVNLLMHLDSTGIPALIDGANRKNALLSQGESEATGYLLEADSPLMLSADERLREYRNEPDPGLQARIQDYAQLLRAEFAARGLTRIPAPTVVVHGAGLQPYVWLDASGKTQA